MKFPRIRSMSARKRRQLPARRACCLAVNVRSGGKCEVCPVIRAGGYAVECSGRHEETHEMVKRSQGGSTIDSTNCLATCRAGHRWLGSNESAARELGLIVSRYPGRAVPTALNFFRQVEDLQRKP